MNKTTVALLVIMLVSMIMSNFYLVRIADHTGSVNCCECDAHVQEWWYDSDGDTVCRFCYESMRD